MDNKKYEEFHIDGCIAVPVSMTENDFWASFIGAVEANNWTFGGGINPIKEDPNEN